MSLDIVLTDDKTRGSHVMVTAWPRLSTSSFFCSNVGIACVGAMYDDEVEVHNPALYSSTVAPRLTASRIQ